MPSDHRHAPTDRSSSCVLQSVEEVQPLCLRQALHASARALAPEGYVLQTIVMIPERCNLCRKRHQMLLANFL